jgi:hypothetical protein
VRHGVVAVRRQGTLDRDVGQRPLAGLPGGEGQQRSGRGHVRLARVPNHIDPQPPVRGAVPGLHPGPGVVTHPQIRDGHREPGELVEVGDLPATAVDADRGADRFPAGLDHQPHAARRCGKFLGSAHRTLGGLGHRLGLRAGQRRERAGQRRPVGAGRQPGRSERGRGWVRPAVERDALGRAAARILAQVRPVPSVLHPQHVAHGQAGRAQGGPERFGDRRDPGAGAIPGGDDRLDPPLLEHRDRVLRDLLRRRRAGRVREVIAEREHDSPAPRVKTDHDHALARVESQQVRDHREEAVHGTDPDPGRRAVRRVVGVRGLVTRWRVICHAARLGRTARLRRPDKRRAVCNRAVSTGRLTELTAWPW